MAVKRLLVVVMMAAVGVVGGARTNAQTQPSQANEPHVVSSQDLDLLRTDAEATKFWPVYDQYTAELVKINDKKFGLIQEYADHWGTMTDEQALAFARQWLDADIAVTQLRQKYVPVVSQVLTGRNTATFFQLDRRISMMIDLQLASQMPLVQAQQ